MARRGLALGSAVLGFWLIGCSGGGMRADAEYTHTTDWDSYQKVNIVTRNGDIRYVVDSNRSDVQITGRKHVSGLTLAEARENLNLVEIVAHPSEDDPRTLVVRLEYPESLSHRQPGASVRLSLPAACSIDLSTSNASIHAESVAGTAVCRTSNGSIHLRDVSGAVDCLTSNASITLKDVHGSVSGRTSNGSIRVDELHAGAKLTTSNARIEAVDVAGDLHAVSSNGSIRFAGRPRPGDMVRLETSNAGIHATLPSDLSGELRLATSNGRVEIQGDQAPMKVRRMSRTVVEGDLNEGGEGGVIARTSNGGVTVVFQ